jgi:uncharacterized membrane protein YeiH
MAAGLAPQALSAGASEGLLRPIARLDFAGVGLFAITGARVAAMVIGMSTATFGGMPRDVLAGWPSVLLARAALGDWTAGIAGASLAFAVRACAIVSWALPSHRG